MSEVDDETSPNLCRFCGSRMRSGFVFCKDCNHFNDWRRLFAVSTPVLGLLVALVSVVGINADNLKDIIAPPRASFLVGAEFNGETNDFEVVATNVGGAVGYLEQVFECVPYNEDGNRLFFSSSVPTTILPGRQTTVPFKADSIYFIKFLIVLEDKLFVPTQPTDGYGITSINEDLGGPWTCSIKAYDERGEIEVVMSQVGLSLFLRNGKVYSDL